MKPTRSIHKIHFEDLSHDQFERLCLSIVYRLHGSNWISIDHFGSSGKDRGVDISAVEELENGSPRTWFVQCKRYKSISKGELKKVVEKALKRIKKPPDIILLMTACNLSREKIEYFRTFAKSKGIKRAEVWASSIIEAKLFAEYHDLLFANFGISPSQERRNRVATLRRNISLKRRMMKDFYKEDIDPYEARRDPFSKFKDYELIIRSIDDNSYPYNDECPVLISPWFRVELFGFYHNGIEVRIGSDKVILDDNGNWDLVNDSESPQKNGPKPRPVMVLGRIPFNNIIDYDASGDECYGCPHVFCDFKNNGTPYEDRVYLLCQKYPDPSNNFWYRLDNEKRKKITLNHM